MDRAASIRSLSSFSEIHTPATTLLLYNATKATKKHAIHANASLISTTARKTSPAMERLDPLGRVPTHSMD